MPAAPVSEPAAPESRHLVLLDEVLKGKEEKGRKVLAPGLVTAESETRSVALSRDTDAVARLFTEDKTTVMMRNIPNRYTCHAALCNSSEVP